MISLLNQKFGKWRVIGEAERRGTFRYWTCQCECGAVHEVYQGALRRKRNPSHSCLKCRSHYSTHGLNRHPIHICWQNMKRRCYDKNHPYFYRYGGRGIKVCSEWRNNAHAFILWAMPLWRDGLQLDRINNDKGYFPANCRFVYPYQNARNK